MSGIDKCCESNSRSAKQGTRQSRECQSLKVGAGWCIRRITRTRQCVWSKRSKIERRDWTATVALRRPGPRQVPSDLSHSWDE